VSNTRHTLPKTDEVRVAEDFLGGMFHHALSDSILDDRAVDGMGVDRVCEYITV